MSDDGHGVVIGLEHVEAPPTLTETTLRGVAMIDTAIADAVKLADKEGFVGGQHALYHTLLTGYFLMSLALETEQRAGVPEIGRASYVSTLLAGCIDMLAASYGVSQAEMEHRMTKAVTAIYYMQHGAEAAGETRQ